MNELLSIILTIITASTPLLLAARGGYDPYGLVAVLSAALVGEGLVFGGPRLIHVDQLVHDPGAFLFLAEMLIGLSLPFVLLRAGLPFGGVSSFSGSSPVGMRNVLRSMYLIAPVSAL